MAARLPCRFFLLGTCRHGDDCRFSHALPDGQHTENIPNGQANGSRPSQGVPQLTGSEVKFRDWRYNIPLDPRRAKRLNPSHAARFWQTALELLDGDAGVVQEVVNLLAGDGGMLRIAELLDHACEDMDGPKTSHMFTTRLLPFFQAISHPNVVTSAVLEGRLVSIYNFVFGPGGERGVRLFTTVAKHLASLQATAAAGTAAVFDETSLQHFEASIVVLSRVVESNTTAQVNEELPTIVKGLRITVDSLPDLFKAQALSKKLNRIEQRLGLGEALPAAQPKKTNQSGYATFTLAKPLPGDLSEDGPRHDNDHTDIREISILPTEQEIQSARGEYLPLSDPAEWHLSGLPGLLDRNFRLLREDTVGQLRDAAKFELERLSQTQAEDLMPTQARQGMRTNVYENLTIENAEFDVFRGLQFVIGFDQPKHLANKSKRERQEWWEGSRRMGSDALVCLLSSTGSATFLVVIADSFTPANKKQCPGVSQLPVHYNLWGNNQRAYIIAQLVKEDDVRPMLHETIRGEMHLSLVEFPGVLLPAFMPTLKALQRMSTSLDLPFIDVLVPGQPTIASHESVAKSEIGPPAYATKPRFEFNLADITKDNTEIVFKPARNLETVAESLVEHSTLDAAQAISVVSSLSRKVALIQGPPGTGKSFTGGSIVKALLANKETAKLGPLLYVTFTNHALDQGGERLLDDSVTQIVRIGGRSQSKRMAQVNLRIVSTKEDLTKTEKKDKWGAQKKMQQETKEINEMLRSVERQRRQMSLPEHLKTNHPLHYLQLYGGTDEEGFTIVNYARSDREIVERWLYGAPDMDREGRPIEELQEESLDALDGPERQMLFQSWLDEMEDDLQDKLGITLAAHNTAKETFDRIRIEKDLRILRQANVIGVTTSGLAKNLDLLSRVNAKVLIVEEAGEVLEAHLLTALLPTIEHVILIGDHQQLRPQIQNYSLSAESHGGRDYALDVSLFERLVRPSNGSDIPSVPLCTLEVQRRMHPSISQLIRETVYPHLQDAASVAEYPAVVGLKKRLFWMHHSRLENEGGDVHSTSHTNDFECHIVAALVSHLVRQGVYRSQDIAVITPYLGQLRKIRSTLAKTMEIVLNERDETDLAAQGDDEPQAAELLPLRRTDIAKSTLLKAVRLATVDNFQGEEAKVIVISLVRSNTHNRAGFLRTTNRINVLLSRAQHGMYIFGNSQTMVNVPVWRQVLELLDHGGNVGDSLQLCCPRHPKTPLSVQVPEDFLRLSPEAGCDLLCDKQLPCGHACVAKCHSEMLHEAVYCTKDRTRPKAGCKHNCPRVCGDVCPKDCTVTISDISIRLDCGHVETSLPCYQYQDPSKVLCQAKVKVIVPGCEHEITKPCFLDVYADGYRCSATCAALLPCGHQCKRSCSDCRRLDESGRLATDHSTCRQICDRNYSTRKHRCQATCHGGNPCELCQQPCDAKCSHSACNKKCSEPCVPCAEAKCASHCPHSECQMPCAAPCDWLPCSLRCSKILACGCRCASVCGEKCPSSEYCQNCASDEVKALQADLVMFEAYRDTDLDEDPCIFAACGHVFTVSSLDGFMATNEYYKFDAATGKIIATKSITSSFSSQALKTCPACRGSLRDISRYGLIVRRAFLDESTKKLTTWSHHKRHALTERLGSEQERLLRSIDKCLKPSQIVNLSGDGEAITNRIKALQTFGRYRAIYKTCKDIVTFASRLGVDEQPYQRVRDMVETARRQSATPWIKAFEFDSAELQLQQTLKAVILQCRCYSIMISDVIAVHEKTPKNGDLTTLKVDFNGLRNACDTAIMQAQWTVSAREEIEARILWAKFAAMECGTYVALDADSSPEAFATVQSLKHAAVDHLRLAKDSCAKLSGAFEDLSAEVEEVSGMLESGISVSELKMVVQAMSKEFGGTGHWYRCVNGHLFTVGGCGMPMQLARCSSCGAGIGGQHHEAVAGVAQARDIDEQFGRLNLG